MLHYWQRSPAEQKRLRRWAREGMEPNQARDRAEATAREAAERAKRGSMCRACRGTGETTKAFVEPLGTFAAVHRECGACGGTGRFVP